MTSRRTRATRARVAAFVWVAVLVSTAACASGGTRLAGTARTRAGPTNALARSSQGVPAGKPNSVFFYDGPMFGTECSYSHSAPDDPIVHPGRPGTSHLHDFFGNGSTDAGSTARSLRAHHGTTCDIQEDTAAYWAPALMRGVKPVHPLFADVYYRIAPGVRARSVVAYPEGLAMVAGAATATEPISTQIVGWGCGYAPAVTSTLPTCTTQQPLTLRVTFPDCWNGTTLDPPDHVSHVAYSGPRGCPRGYPVAFPELTVIVRYPVAGDPAGLHPSSGPPYTAHADFLNAWDPVALATNVTACLRRGVVCSVPRAGQR